MAFFARYIKKLLVLSFIAMLAGIAPTVAESRTDKAVVVFHCDYPPVSYWDKKTNKPSGFFIDIMDSVAARTGLSAEYDCKNSWPEIINAVERGEGDIGVLMKSEEREKRLLFSTPIYESYLVFFARSKSRIDFDEWPTGYTVGVVRDGMSHEMLKGRPEVTIQTEGTYQEGIFALLAGKIDLFAGEDSMILKTAREAGLDEYVRRVGKPFSERQRCLVVNKNNKLLLERLNQALSGFVGSPEYQQIYLKWYGKPAPFWTVSKMLIAGSTFLLLAVGGMAFWRYRTVSQMNAALVSEVKERRKAESSLELFKNLINKSSEAIFVNDPQTGRLIDMNDRACTSLGYSREELLTMGVRDIEMKFPDHVLWQDHVSEVRRQGFLLLEGLHRRKDGTTFPVETNVNFVVLGGKGYMIAVVRNITERRRAEEALRTREMQLAESQRIAHIGSWEHNLTNGRVFWSDELFRMLGLDPKRDPADFGQFFGRVHPEDQRALKAAIEETRQKSVPFSIDYRYILPDGTIRILHAEGELIRSESGEMILSGTGQDITQRMQADAAIREKNAQLQALIHAIPDMVVFKDLEGRHVLINKTTEKLTGLNEAQFVGKTVEELLPADEAVMCRQGDELAMRNSEPTQAEEYINSGGKIVYLDTIKAPIYDEQGTLKGLVAVCRDATRRKLAELELKESIKRAENERARAEAIIAAIGDSLLIIDDRFTVLYQNEASQKMLGNLTGKVCYKAGEGRSSVCDNCPVELAFRDGQVHRVGRTRGTGSQTVHLDITSSPLRDSSGKIIGVIEMIRDITESKQAEQALSASEKNYRALSEELELLNQTLAERVREEIEKNRAKEQLIQLQSRHAAMGEMINNIAHQWRQPLNNLGLTVQSVEANFGSGKLTSEMVRDKVKLSMFLINYMSETINDFSNFFRPDKSIVKFRIREVIDVALGFMETTLKRNAIEVLVKVPDEITVTGYRNEYTQVVVNILTNARDVLVERSVQKPVIRLNASRENGVSVLSIADNGGGVQDSIIDKIFAPYFTTKAHAKGTGIGLYISKTIIENNMNGKLSVLNNPEGAEFRVEVKHG